MNSDGMQRPLRELRHQAAGEPPHQVTIAAVRRRVVRRRAMEAVAGSAVLAAVISSVYITGTTIRTKLNPRLFSRRLTHAASSYMLAARN